MSEDEGEAGEVAFGPGVLIERAREKLRDALTMLGDAAGDDVEDGAVTDAGVSVIGAGEMLEDAFRMRVDEQASVHKEPEGESDG